MGADRKSVACYPIYVSGISLVYLWIYNQSANLS